MTAIAGPFLIVCVILGLGGVAKLVAPAPARRAIHALGLTVPLLAVRALGVAELGLAGSAMYFGGPVLPVVVGAAYLSFGVFVALILRSDTGTSCGCFGTSSAPPSVLHVVFNMTAAATAFAATDMDTLGTILDDQPAAGMPLLGLVALGSYLAFLLLSALPEVLAPPQPTIAEFSVEGAGL